MFCSFSQSTLEIKSQMSLTNTPFVIMLNFSHVFLFFHFDWGLRKKLSWTCSSLLWTLFLCYKLPPKVSNLKQQTRVISVSLVQESGHSSAEGLCLQVTHTAVVHVEAGAVIWRGNSAEEGSASKPMRLIVGKIRFPWAIGPRASVPGFPWTGPRQRAAGFHCG